jgi:hypothetical protein
VKPALRPGLVIVSRADVSFGEKEARVMCDPGQVSVEQLIDAMNRIGFRAALKAGGATNSPPDIPAIRGAQDGSAGVWITVLGQTAATILACEHRFK